MADNEQTSTAPEPGTPAEGADSQGGFAEAFAERAAPEPTETKADAQAPAAKEEPAATAAGTEAPSQEAADASSGTKATAFDPYAGLTPEQKAHFERLAASERSNRGRVGALTKKLNGFTAGTQAPPTETGASRERSDEGAGGSGTGDGTGKTPTDIEARLKAVTDEYGDIIGPVAEIVQELRTKIDGLEASATRHEVDRDAEALTQAYTALEAAHPDYQQVAADQAFHQWLGEQTTGVKALANSFDPKEVSLALQLFKTERGAVSGASTETSEGGNGGNTATGDRRERQLEGMRQAPSRGAPAATGVPNDFGSAFKSRAAQAK